MRLLLSEAPGSASCEPAAALSVWPSMLDEGWQCVSTPAAACASPQDLPQEGWLAASVPGTVAAAWRAAGRLDLDQPAPFAFDDHWFVLRLTARGKRRLRFNGLATLAEVWLDGEKILSSDSMFVAHEIDVDLCGDAQLALAFRSLTPALAARRGRARWRPRLVSPPTLRNLRTTLLGHMPGWCPSVQAVGPWRPVELLSDAQHAFAKVDLATRVDGPDGIVTLSLSFVHPQADTQAAQLACGSAAAALAWADPHTLTGELRVPDAERWWPHTHGAPTLHEITLRLGDASFELGQVGFRTIEVDRGADGEGFALRINGVPVFCRGACWTSADLVTLGGTTEQLTQSFALVCDAGLNMLRVGGTMLYESDAFYALADRCGVLIWQDFAFANFDYPTDEGFVSSVRLEAEQFLGRTRRHASLAVLCGGSEVDQQASMLGLPPALRAQPLFTAVLAEIAGQARPDVPYVANSPSGGLLPFSTRSGITHYYGVGAYLRPLDDVRRSQVRFASECLAFANVPDDATLNEALHTQHAHHPRWKAAVPRDPGAGWDFDDVRDHYLRTLYGIDPARMRYEDPQRYLDLSRAVVAELMSEVFAEWRRHGSTCGGGLVWQLQDLRAGAGWGIVDALGRPKSAWHGVAQVLGPIQVLLTDEGLNGLDVHLINDTPASRQVEIEIVSLRDGGTVVARGTRLLELSAHNTQRLNAADLLGQFFDFTYAYRFGPRTHDVTIATLRDPHTAKTFCEAFHLPDRQVQDRHDLGLEAHVEATPHGWQLVLKARRFARFIHVADPHYRVLRDWFHLPPNTTRIVPLVPLNILDASAAPEGEVRAINASAPVFYRCS